MILAAETDIWRYQPHPEVWVLIAGVLALAWYATRVIAPSAVAPGQPVATHRNKVAFVAAVAALWVASDWPMHDISEEYLYSAHMVQHLTISMVIPPLLLVATPEWLARLVVTPDGPVGQWLERLTHPVVAGVVFNVVIAVTHLTTIVNTSVENGPVHYLVHLAVFSVSMLMWIPVVSPIPELRIGLAGQMVFLFLMSVIPTIPAGFLTFADGALYSSYDHDVRLWGISVTGDQQAAGFIMKLVGGLYLWGWIIVRFFQWNHEQLGDQPGMVLVPSAESLDDPAAADLTYEDVQAEFEKSGPAPSEA